MRFRLPPEAEAFRDEVREFLAPWRDLNGFFHQDREWDRVRAFYRALGERNWLALGWPVEMGGLGASPLHEFILWDEAAYARVARPPLSAGVVAKTIVRAGTPEQHDRWLPPIRRGEIHFSLGYSEPQAGSDLASVRTRAELREDGYVVQGEKCWTSYAQHSDHLWLLCRTGSVSDKSAAVSLLIVDLDASGVTVSPLPTLDGEQLNAVHLDAVEVAADRRIGPEGGAWKLMSAALADERHVQFPPRRLRRDLEDVVSSLAEGGCLGDAEVRRRVADLAVGVREVELLGLHVVEQVERGHAAVAEAAANKVAHTELAQRIAEAALELGGPEALACDRPAEFLWRQSLWETIGGGTSEVMRSVVARQALRLGGRR
ncbi:MAG: acyl-CoA dehydrogenase family protein [Myxococcales bacterium]|nr:acyl-CoA dehydrogenase family protein [Myxococcales bacterium]